MLKTGGDVGLAVGERFGLLERTTSMVGWRGLGWWPQHHRWRLKQLLTPLSSIPKTYHRYEFYELRNELDELRDLERTCKEALRHSLLASADVVGATCTGAGGPELAGETFGLVIMDEGSQASE